MEQDGRQESKLFPEAGSTEVITCAALTNDFLIYATQVSTQDILRTYIRTVSMCVHVLYVQYIRTVCMCVRTCPVCAVHTYCMYVCVYAHVLYVQYIRTVCMYVNACPVCVIYTYVLYVCMYVHTCLVCMYVLCMVEPL